MLAIYALREPASDEVDVSAQIVKLIRKGQRDANVTYGCINSLELQSLPE